MIAKMTLDRYEGDKAVLKTESGETVVWPKMRLPAGVREGSVMNFDIRDDRSAENEKKEMAKKILNEILDV